MTSGLSAFFPFNVVLQIKNKKNLQICGFKVKQEHVLTFVSITVISTDGETDQSACFPETNTSMTINSSQLEGFLKKEREKKKKKEGRLQVFTN